MQRKVRNAQDGVYGILEKVKIMLGLMIDCARNAVMKISELKKLAGYMKEFGYDSLMLYLEDVFEVNNEPNFGHMRGRYSKTELKELDAYCNAIGIELIPAVQTLAHLGGMFKWWDTYDRINDIDDVLLIGEDRTYELIDNILSTVSECFTTRKVHIGMDEAFKVGLGKYLQKHGYEDRFELINRHLHQVCEIASKYDFEPMVWSDMFTTLALNNMDYYADISGDDIKKRSNLPENVSLVYWDYYSEDYDHYVKMIDKTKVFGNPVIFTGAIWTWRGFAPDNEYSMRITSVAAKACKDCQVEDTFYAMWGDDGAECSKWALIPSIFYTAEISKGNTDIEKIQTKFFERFGMTFEDFFLLDKTDKVGGLHNRGSASKYLLYNDPFNGLFDMRISGNENQFYENLRDELDRVNVTEDFKHSFAYIRALCDVLSVKSELGFKTRKYYNTNDKIALQRLAENEYAQVIVKLEKFYEVFKAMWFSENKPHGFDVQDIRIGALAWRIKSCRMRLVDYCEGRCDCILELEEDVIAEAASATAWSRMVTANVLSHIF